MKKKKQDPLAVEQAEMLRMIEHLHEADRRLHDVVGVSRQACEGLQRLDEQVAKPPGPDEWRPLADLALEVLVKLAVELLVKALS